MTEKLYRKCLAYQKAQLKVPAERLVQRWGQQMGLSRQATQDVSSALELRFAYGKYYFYYFFKCIMTMDGLGGEPGYMNNTPRWKKSTPPIFRSPFLVQGDIGKSPGVGFPPLYKILNKRLLLGFFSKEKRKYGQFIVFVQTFTKHVWACPLPNTRFVSLLAAIKKMQQVG